MKVLFYSYSINGAGKKVKEIIDDLIPKKKLEIHQAVESLSQRLKKKTIDVGIVVLLASSKKELWDLLSIRDQLIDHRIILILPDREEGTISQGHSLYPRFLSYADSNFKDFAAVIKKMLTHLNFIQNK
jgi:hypothetical protein